LSSLKSILAISIMTKIKGNPLLSVRLPADLNQLIDAQVATTGKSRSEIAIAALSAFLTPASSEDEIAQIKHRIQLLEAAMQREPINQQ
jgi:metal-responsive CopG/Arc/MetJ family transcriptional regulator